MANAQYDLQNIKAGVEGGLGDVPSPDDAPSPNANSGEDFGAPPETIVGNGYAERSDYDRGNSFDLRSVAGRVNPVPQGTLDTERIQELVETIIQERWEDLMQKMGNLPAWKERVAIDLSGVKQELMRLEERFEQLQGAILGKVKDYDEGVRSIHTEMKALEKVFERILEPLTSNIKELDRLTKDLKKR